MVKFETVGRHQLAAKGKGASEIARKLGVKADGRPNVNQSTVSRWLSGESRPDTNSAALIEAIFLIPVPSWLTAEELANREALSSKEASQSGEHHSSTKVDEAS